MPTATKHRPPWAPESYRCEHSNVVVLRVHSIDECLDTASWGCPIHAPSDHPMRGWEQTWSPLFGFGRVCPTHGVVHPDPDDVDAWVDHDTCCDGV
jgi:hypothetical protein